MFDCSENEEAFNESARGEESSASASHEFDSTHNTSTTSQEEDAASDSQSQNNNLNGTKDSNNDFETEEINEAKSEECQQILNQIEDAIDKSKVAYESSQEDNEELG